MQTAPRSCDRLALPDLDRCHWRLRRAVLRASIKFLESPEASSIATSSDQPSSVLAESAPTAAVPNAVVGPVDLRRG
jgi:hypothetical protein